MDSSSNPCMKSLLFSFGSYLESAVSSTFSTNNNTSRHGSGKRRRRKSSSWIIILFISIIIVWFIIIILIFGRLEDELLHSDNSYSTEQLQPNSRGLLATIKGSRGRLGSSSSSGSYYHSSHRIKPRVIIMYACPTINNDYKYITERISPSLSKTSEETLCRTIRHHDYYFPFYFTKNTPKQQGFVNYKMAISGNYFETFNIQSSLDPLIDSDSLTRLKSIEEDSEDYEDSLAEPLDDDECEMTPQQELWMVQAKSTCNYIHEHDMRQKKTKLLGNGYWRDVWPVYDSEPSSFFVEKKVALKTIRWMHDFDDWTFHRQSRDAIVSERLTSSPRVTSIFAFCGNSGFFDFANGGSLTDRLEAHWEALDDAKNEEEEEEAAEERGKQKSDDTKDERILDQRTKLSLAHDIAAALADLHDADGMRDAHGDIISASMVHADLTTDQFIKIDGQWKLNDFNRCKFMRRRRNTGIDGGDGTPCGFQFGINPGKSRSPEEYNYQEETEKVDIYSLGNVFYTILTDEIPFDDVSSNQAVKDIKNGIRAKIPPRLLKSEDPVDIALRTVVEKTWRQEPQDRPRARALADYLAKELEKIANANKT